MGQKESSINSSSESKCDVKPKPDSRIKLPTDWYDHQLLVRCKHIDFDVEAWYNILQSETFNTEFIPLSPLVAQAFVNYYQTRFNSRKSMTSNDIQLIQSIQNQIKEQLLNFKTKKFQNNNIFIRLSSRSPKDGMPLDSQKLSQFYQQELNRLQTNYPNEYDSVKGKANMQLIACHYAQFHSLKVTDEIQALNLILTSERVFSDLLEALDCQQVQENKIANVNNIKLHDWNNNIIIREWNDLLDHSMEFRCFVYRSNLTAISQYNHYCKFYHLQDDRIVQRIKQTIIRYWQEEIQPLLNPLTEKYSNYIIDIGLIENTSSNEYDCIVIEMNPFETSTGSSLFDWTIDNNQLMGEGNNEIEIRVRSDYYPYIEDTIEYILEVYQCNEKKYSSADHHGADEPYFIFLDKIKTQLSA